MGLTKKWWLVNYKLAQVELLKCKAVQLLINKN